ncbi:uncharacterized protein VTP21DRAFT_570 [Calcarisporiella thermophila]|uniref:uncharacterized protein n=1 Tax=Calcarisporiella thermophila TaxID=911321 RepID=UPI0037422EA2
MSLQRYVRNYITGVSSGDSYNELSTVRDAIIQVVADHGNKNGLLELVQALGEYLTSDEAIVRAKGIELLSTVLAKCPATLVSKQETTVLVDFFCERLSDTVCVPELLKGILTLQKFPSFTDEDALKVTKAIFSTISVQNFQQATRYVIFQIFDGLMHEYLQALKKLGSDFVLGFVQALDGEKDPRNLMLAFTLAKRIIDEFDITNHVEDLFEVTFCYFPITFRPPPDDPYGITAEDLKINLRACLSSSPLFAKFAMPLLLEKMSSSSGNAKRDAFETLVACAPVYGVDALVPHLEELRLHLKEGVYNATEDAIENAALDAIRCTSMVLSANVSLSSKSDPMEAFLRPLINECTDEIKEPELKQAKPSGKILQSAASASDPAFVTIASAVLPTLLQLYRESEVITRRKALLDIIWGFLESSRMLYGSIDETKSKTDDSEFVTPLLSDKDRLFELFTDALISSNEYNGFRLAGLSGLKSLVLHRRFLSDNETGIVVQHLIHGILNESDTEMSSESLKALSQLAQLKPEIILDVAMPTLISGLPDTADEAAGNQDSYTDILKAISELAIDPILFDATAPQLLRKLNGAGDSFDASYPCALLDCLLSLLLTKSLKKHTDIGRFINIFVPHLIALCVKPTIQQEESAASAMTDKDVLNRVARIIAITMRNLDTKQQDEFLRNVFGSFLLGDISWLKLEEIQSVSFQPLVPNARFSQANLTLLFCAAIGSCRNLIPVESIIQFLTDTMTLCLHSESELQRLSLATILGSVINKWTDEESMANFLQTNVFQVLKPVINDAAAKITDRQRAILVWQWLAKGLLLKAHNLGYEMVSEMIACFHDPELGRSAAESFVNLIGNDDEKDIALTQQSFATVRLLYKQRFFDFCMPKIVDGFHHSSDDARYCYLIAMSHILRNIPKQVLLNELGPFVPLLVHSLSLPDDKLKYSTLKTLSMIIQEAPGIISSHVGSLVPLLLDLSQMQQHNTMSVRIESLKCLAIFPATIRYDLLYPYKTQVLRELAKPLDDRKRLVRREAVECRAKWYAFTGPEEV